MAGSFIEERLKILKIEMDNVKVRVGKLEVQLKALQSKLESLDENVYDIMKWR